MSGNPTVRDYLQTAKSTVTEAVNALPATSRGILGACVAAYVVNLLFVNLWSSLGLEVDAIVSGWQVYRLFSYTLIHPVLLGLIINTVVLLTLSSRLERALGTLPTAWVLLCTFSALPGLLFVAAAAVLNRILGTSIGGSGPLVGLGPIIFACIVWISSQDGAGSYSLFGRYTIQAAYYPWLLFAISALLSNFDYILLHGAGMAVGYLYVQGRLGMMTPSPDIFLRAETETRVGRWIASKARNFVSVEEATGLQTTLAGWLPVWTADVSDVQERGAASTAAASSPSLGSAPGGSGDASSALSSSPLTGSFTPGGTAATADQSFPGQGHKLGGA